MNKILTLIIYLSALAYSNAQTGAVEGRIKDKLGKPVVNATVVLEKTNYGNSTDDHGKFSIKDVPAGNYALRFSGVGYQPRSQSIEVKANEKIEVNFEAEEKIEVLREVEVSGVKSITGMGYMEDHGGVIYSGKKTEVLLLDSLDANTAQNNPRQVLGRVPGANYSETEGSGFPSNGIGFRGLNPTQSVETNTRQNGYNITADLYGYPESYYLPTLEAVARIEGAAIRGRHQLCHEERTNDQTD